ncbi:MAG TPA: glycosyltransferase family 4 protein [Azospirillaceae bacterium]|nr:glycosyltransferase family 4 protein [Azospirillaceae bacterium]
MRIVHLVRQFRPSVGGLENYVDNLAREQGRAGHEVTVVTLDRLFRQPDTRLPASEATPDYRIVRIPWRGSSKYPVAPAFLGHLRDADIVHVHAVDFFFDAVAATKVLHRKPIVATTHGGFFHTNAGSRFKRAFFHTVTRTTIKAYDAVFACSEGDLATFTIIRPDGLVLVENGVDCVKFRGQGSPDFVKSMVFVGRFSANKRLDRLIRFLACLNARDPGWDLTIAGVEWDIGPADLDRLAEEHGVKDRVRVMTGISDGELRTVLAGCSVAVSASEYEGFGIAVVEGMSAGLLPLLNDIPSFRRIHEGSGVGLVVDFAAPDAAAEAFTRLLPAMRSEYAARRGRAMAYADGFGWGNVAARIQTIYDGILAERGCSAPAPRLASRGGL